MKKITLQRLDANVALEGDFILCVAVHCMV